MRAFSFLVKAALFCHPKIRFDSSCLPTVILKPILRNKINFKNKNTALMPYLKLNNRLNFNP